MENLHKKTRANAVSSYLMIGISWAFLWNRDNEYINNDFVKSHTKTALLLHLGFLLTYIIFIHLKPLPFFSILGYSLNDIVAVVGFFVLLAAMLIGITRANKGNTLSSGELIKMSGDKKLLDINGDLKINEHDKLTLILSHIPFIGAYLYGKYANYKVVQNIGVLNLTITSAMLLLYIAGSENTANFIGLIYIIYIVFVSISLFIQDKLIQIQTHSLPTPASLRLTSLAVCEYLGNYFGKKRFINFSELKVNLIVQEAADKKALEKKLQALPDTQKLQKYAVYIQSAVVLLGLCIIIILGNIFGDISFRWLSILLLSTLYTIGYIRYSLSYKTPFIHDIYILFAYVYTQTKNLFVKTKALHDKEEVVNLKVAGK